ncbi:hypothetical protein RFN29_02460 [Mesorhizobium sp. VK22B]|uniref:Uncharacterized protein n=1 Tax=Mesorhizobium captivum TaxID=3072319 RepID=A0ABU4YUR0_9HYPH|nr:MULTISPECIES: hypothetical protein [unclassified Mesorhizobium]MDX8490431.1 hypothetical protein [Mesorhizobium sp. VK22B]MDX8504713.1 hypothetical protein [Mesorhizobium sp. VK22E]
MRPLLQALHPIAVKRGDGLRPEFLRMDAEEALTLTFPHIQSEVEALPRNRAISILASTKPPSK